MTIHGSAHVAGLYHVTAPGTGSFLRDGFELIRGLGFGAVKFFMSSKYATQDYTFDTWGAAPTNLTELAQKSQFATVFGDATFQHYILNVFGFTTGSVDSLWKFGLSTQTTLLADAYTEYYNLATHLGTTYPTKQFVLQSWEGDWELQNQEILTTDGFVNTTGRLEDLMVAYYRARAHAVRDARKAGGFTNVRIAMECNRVVDALDSRTIPRLVNRILPRVRGLLDAVSYSAYDSIFGLSGEAGGSYYTSEAVMLTEISRKLPLAIQRIQDAAEVPVYIGEWGIPEAEVPMGYDASTIINHVITEIDALDPEYSLYWQVFDNEGPAKRYWLYDDLGGLSTAGGVWQSYYSA